MTDPPSPPLPARLRKFADGYAADAADDIEDRRAMFNLMVEAADQLEAAHAETTRLRQERDAMTLQLEMNREVTRAQVRRAEAAEARVQALEQQIREVCICAAIKLSNGEIWRGHRHDDCLSTAGRIHPRTMLVSAEQGFITSRNRFVGREEGAELQRAAGIRSVATGREVRDMLFSEDLYMRDLRDSASPGAPRTAPPEERPV